MKMVQQIRGDSFFELPMDVGHSTDEHLLDLYTNVLMLILCFLYMISYHDSHDH